MSQTLRCAIVTGSSRGIGAAVAERLARDGLAVVINYSGHAEPAEKLAGRITRAGGKAIACKADVSDAASVAAMFDAATDAFGGVDVLVNNAGIMKLAPIADSDDALVDSHLAINLKGVINTLREAGRRLRDGGRVINFSSSVVGLYQPTYGVYAATKAGVERSAVPYSCAICESQMRVKTGSFTGADMGTRVSSMPTGRHSRSRTSCAKGLFIEVSRSQ